MGRRKKMGYQVKTVKRPTHAISTTPNDSSMSAVAKAGRVLSAGAKVARRTDIAIRSSFLVVNMLN
jgi:hypothetical protein